MTVHAGYMKRGTQIILCTKKGEDTVYKSEKLIVCHLIEEVFARCDKFCKVGTILVQGGLNPTLIQ